MLIQAETKKGGYAILLLFVGVFVLSIWKGLLVGAIPVALILFTELFPKIEKHANENGVGVLHSLHWTFYVTWYAFWLCVIFGSWAIFGPLARYFAWIGLLIPVLILEMLLGYWIPMISARLVWIARCGRFSSAFCVLGTWWGDGMKFFWLPDDKLLVASQNELGWTRHLMDAKRRFSIWPIGFVDGVLVGFHPPMLPTLSRENVLEDEAGASDIKTAERLAAHYPNHRFQLLAGLLRFFMQASPKRTSKNLIGRKVPSI